MVEFENIGSRPLPREARGYRDADADDFFRDATELIIAVRLARMAWECGLAAPGELHAFTQALRSGIRNGVTLPALIEETQSWASGWWRRAAAAKWR